MRRLVGIMRFALFSLLVVLTACEGYISSNNSSVARSEAPPLLEARESAELSFSDPETDCAECHPSHVEQWRISNHAYAAKDPVFHAMVRVGQKQTEGKLGQFCVQCHSPTGLATGQTPVEFDETKQEWVQRFDELDEVGQQGVSCDVCHSITNVIEPVNARLEMTPNGVKHATIKDPVATPAHGSSYSELHGKSELCGSCHAVTNPRGALIEETFPEWEKSDFAKDGIDCQDCHMPEYRGRATPDGPERDLHRHTFVGVDVSLLAPEEFPGYDEMRTLTADLLRESASMRVQFDQTARRLELEIQNHAGHALPSGATAERQMWVELLIEDEQGQLVFESGTLDANGDIRDGVDKHSTRPGSDPQLVYFGQQLIKISGISDAPDEAAKERMRHEAEEACIPMGKGGVKKGRGVAPVTFPWAADWQCNYLIPADGVARPTYDLSTLAPGRYKARLRLKFRTFPLYFLRQLEDVAGLDPAVKERVPVVVIDEAVVALAISDHSGSSEDDSSSNLPADTPEPPRVGEVVVNEIFADPYDSANPSSGDSNGDGEIDARDDEFVELINVSDRRVSLEGCRFEDMIRTRHIFGVNGQPVTLDPGAGVVVFGGGHPPVTIGGAKVELASSGQLALNNDGDSLSLRCTASGEPVDAVVYDRAGGNNEALLREHEGSPDAGFIPHTQQTAGRRYSPGTCADGGEFSSCL